MSSKIRYKGIWISLSILVVTSIVFIIFNQPGHMGESEATQQSKPPAIQTGKAFEVINPEDSNLSGKDIDEATQLPVNSEATLDNLVETIEGLKVERIETIKTVEQWKQEIQDADQIAQKSIQLLLEKTSANEEIVKERIAELLKQKEPN